MAKKKKAAKKATKKNHKKTEKDQRERRIAILSNRKVSPLLHKMCLLEISRGS